MTTCLLGVPRWGRGTGTEWLGPRSQRAILGGGAGRPALARCPCGMTFTRVLFGSVLEVVSLCLVLWRQVHSWCWPGISAVSFQNIPECSLHPRREPWTHCPCSQPLGVTPLLFSVSGLACSGRLPLGLLQSCCLWSDVGKVCQVFQAAEPPLHARALARTCPRTHTAPLHTHVPLHARGATGLLSLFQDVFT